MKIKIEPSQCSTAVLSYFSTGNSAKNVVKDQEYDSNNVYVKWEWSRPVAGCDMALSCSTSPPTIDLCSSGNDHTITQTNNVETAGNYHDTFVLNLNTVDKVTYPPGVYTITVIVNLVENPSDTVTTVLTMTLTDTCDQQISVNAIPV